MYLRAKTNSRSKQSDVERHANNHPHEPAGYWLASTPVFPATIGVIFGPFQRIPPALASSSLAVKAPVQPFTSGSS